MSINSELSAHIGSREERTNGDDTRTTTAQEVAQSKPRPGAHLYIMQATSGLIKIGRSNNPKARARSLEQTSGQRIKVLFVLVDKGELERGVHAMLDEHRGLGEWFRDTAGCRRAICEAMGGAEIKWLYGEGGNLAKANAVRRENIQQRERAVVEEAVADLIRCMKGRGYLKHPPPSEDS